MVRQRLGSLIQRTFRATAFALFTAGTLFGAAVNSAGADDGQRAMLTSTIAVDRHYIPALVAIQKRDQEAAESAMMRFSEVWADHATTFAVNRDDPEWQHYMDIASGMVSTAFVEVREGDLQAAEAEMRAVRTTLHGLRERNGIDYYVDQLNAYKPFMDALIHTAREKQGSRFTMPQIRQLQKNWAQVWPRWENIRRHVSQAEFDQELYGFSDDRFVELKQAVAEEQMALNRLRQALRRGPHQEMAEAAIGLEAGFMRTYRVFGDLPYE